MAAGKIELFLHVLSSTYIILPLLICLLVMLFLVGYIVKLKNQLHGKEIEVQEMQKDLKRVRAIVENEVVGCYIRDREGKILYANEKYLSLVGRKREEVIGANMLHWVYEEDREYMAKTMKTTNTSEGINFAHFRYIRPDGSIVWVKAVGFILQGQRPTQVLVICWNVGEGEFTGEQLKNFMEPIVHILDYLGEGLIATDERGYIVLINSTAEQILGWKRTEVYKRKLEDAFCVEDESLEGNRNLFFKICRGDFLASGGASPVTIINRKGERRPIFLSAAALKDSDDNCVGGIIIFKDASAYVKNQQELLRLERLEALSLIASGIAHDFNNLLGGILASVGFIKAFCSKYQDEELRRKIEHIERAGIKSRELVQKLMVFSKRENSSREAFPLVPLLEETSKFILAGSDIKISVEVEEELCPVWGDKVQIEQVLQNIVLNAREAMQDKGTLRIKAQMFSYERGDMPLKAGRYVMIEIKDTGCGVPKEVLPRIFDPYFTTKPHGTGLGLAAAYQIVRSHGGYIKVNSDLGKGTTFFIYFPCAEGKGSCEKEVREGKRTSPLDFSKNRILFIDDDINFGEMMEEMVYQLGGNIVWFKEGEAALSHYLSEYKRGNLYHLIILDISLSGNMSGWDVGKEILRCTPSARVVACTGHREEEIKNKCKKFGFKDVIFKPFTLKEFTDFLKKWLE